MSEVIYKTPYRNVILDIHEGIIGISFSGGADSTILLYIMLLNGITPDKIYVAYRNGFKNAAIDNTLIYLENLFNVELRSKVHDFILANDQIRNDIYSTIEEVDWLYTGVTQNPVNWDYKGVGPIRPFTAMNNKYRSYVTPFITFDKRATIFLFSMFGINDLLELTRSCPKHDSVPACGECFHCQERKWAIAEVQK